MEMHPEAEVLVHPESPEAVIALADVVGSTTRLIRAATESKAKQLIVATDYGIFHKMREAAPDKELIVAPTGGIGATCTSCAHCPWMAMNSLENLCHVLETGANPISIPEDIRVKALVPIERMLEFSRNPPQDCD
jgi:quinolinate synthase